MLDPTSTARKIDEFESRFTTVNAAHFLIAANGKEAYPISAAEASEFKALYRRRMMWARWLRRIVVIGPFALLFLTPSALGPYLFAWGVAPYLLFLPLGLIQHPIVSDLTKVSIERRLKRRITTRLPAAVTPARTPLGRFARRLLLTCIALEIGMVALHAMMGMDALAEHMRIMYRQGNGHEGLLAQVTGNLVWGVLLAAMFSMALMMVDRWSRRLAAVRAEKAEAAKAADAARDDRLRTLGKGSTGNRRCAVTASLTAISTGSMPRPRE
jgi:hypothetical protein